MRQTNEEMYGHKAKQDFVFELRIPLSQGALVEEGMDIPTARTTEYMLLLAFLSGQNIMAFSGFVRYIRALSK